MPIMDGMELISEINKIEANPIIIVLATNNESKLLQKLINLDINYFLNKPVEKASLINKGHGVFVGRPLSEVSVKIIKDVPEKLILLYTSSSKKTNSSGRSINIDGLLIDPDYSSEAKI